MEQRIQKILSQWGVASRRQAEEMIKLGRVKLNGNIATIGDKANPLVDQLIVDGKIINYENRPRLIYILLNKPAGVLCTCRDPQKRRTVLDLLPPQLGKNQGLHPVGRLDGESTGALILTNDGELTVRLTHPKYHLLKTYHVWINSRPSEATLTQWREGIDLLGKKTLPALVSVLKYKNNTTLLEIGLHEGRNRQIRKIANQLGFDVLQLHRIAIGNIQLEKPLLEVGKYRYLKKSEICFLKDRVKL